MINKIHNEDCLETIAKLDKHSIDAVITSPPYNTMGGISDRGYDLYEDNLSEEEYISLTLKIFNGMHRVLKEDGVILYNMSYGTQNTTLMSLTIADIIRGTDFTLADIIIWKKDNATPNNVSHNKLTRIVEYVYVFCKKDDFKTFKSNKELLYRSEKTGANIYANTYNFIKAKNNDGENHLNKATYSTEFVRKLIDMYVADGSTIYDPFMGTGTTAVAAMQCNCHFVGSELSPDQCKYANDRTTVATGKVGLFA